MAGLSLFRNCMAKRRDGVSSNCVVAVVMQKDYLMSLTRC